MSIIRQLVLVTGMSGAGKSSVLHYLEDLGFFWVDNLPLTLIPTFLDHFETQEEGPSRVAVGGHIRDASCLDVLAQSLHSLRGSAARFDLIFVDASHDALVTRYRATRRRHPVARDHTIREAVALESSLLNDVRAVADHTIDTSAMTVPMLKDHLDQLFSEKAASGLKVFLRSFGFKYGASTDADIVLDARFLTNPYYDLSLRTLTGMDQPVRDFLEHDGEAEVFLARIVSLMEYLIPQYRNEKKRYLTVDIGCTGGCHRSVYMVDRLCEKLNESGLSTHVRHRDMEREVASHSG
ncbi:MAG: RNase adapter RapZ [Magnetococcales bacterium]|nr:RNase adapter RapZ [Magnetococcales bacterium]